MKRILLAAAIITQSICLMAQNGPSGLNLNDKAPDFTAADQNGKNISLKKELIKNS